MLVSCEPSPENDVAVTVPTTLTPVELIVTADPTTVEVNDGVSDNVIVAPAPDAVAVKLLLTKLISVILSATPTTDPSSLIVTPVTPPPPPPEPMELPSDFTKAVARIVPLTSSACCGRVLPIPTEYPLPTMTSD